MSEPIRILHVLGGLDRGGAETMVMNLYRNVDRSKIQFDFIIHTDKECDYNNEVLGMGGKIYNFPRYQGSNHFLYISSWKEFFKSHPEYKIVHGHVRSTAWFYLKVAKNFGLVTIAHSHNTSTGKGIPSIIKGLFQFPIRNVADIYFACSQTAGVWLFGQKACKSTRFHIVKNAIDTTDFEFDSEIREAMRSKFNYVDHCVILHVGRFHEQKNHTFLIDVFKEIHHRIPTAILLLIGDGKLKKDIQRKVTELNLDKYVHFLGTQSDVKKYLQVADLFLFPSLFEGLPVSLIEAQISGLKCIISNTITNEVVLNKELVEVVSLKQKPKVWADRAHDSLNHSLERKATKNYLGYDVTESAKWISEFYLYHHNSPGVVEN